MERKEMLWSTVKKMNRCGICKCKTEKAGYCKQCTSNYNKLRYKKANGAEERKEKKEITKANIVLEFLKGETQIKELAIKYEVNVTSVKNYIEEHFKIIRAHG